MLNGKLGFVAAYTVQGSNGPLGTNTQLPVLVPSYGTINGNTFSKVTGLNNIGANVANQPLYNTTTLVACCVSFYSNFNDRAALLKAKYNFSDTTSLTGTFIDGEAYADQDGNHIEALPMSFVPGAGYAAANGPAINVPDVFAYYSNEIITPEYEIDHEPNFTAELHTSLGDNSIVARAYSANISRLQTSPGSPLATQNINLNLYGTATVNGVPTTFTGQSATIGIPPGSGICAVNPIVLCTQAQINAGDALGYESLTYYQNAEEDRLRGASFEFDHPFGNNGDLLTASYDYNKNSSHTYDYNSDPYPNSDTIPLGSYQTFGTILARGIFNFGSKLNLTLSNYFTQDGSYSTQNYGVSWTTAHSSRYDPRIAFTDQINRDVSLRASAGGAISYPYLSILDGANSAPPTGYVLPQNAQQIAYATNSLGNPGILPETSFGYDIGADVRVPGSQLVFESDVYLTNLFNEFLSTTYVSGMTGPLCPTTGGPYTVVGANCVNGATTYPYEAVPLYSTQTVNIGDARYAGIEFAVRDDPPMGIGFQANLALERAYNYNISPCIYSKLPGCPTPLVNLGVVNGINFPGSFESGTTAAGVSLGAVQNHAIPYSQGYGDIHYRFANNGLLSFGLQYYGPNNSLDVPAFFMGNLTARVGIGDNGNSTLQMSIYNITGAYPSAWSTYSGGVQQPLANGQVGATAANSIGPTQFTFVLSHKFGN